MPSRETEIDREAVATWAKRCYIAGRAAMEALLRPHGLGATQWYVLHHLAVNGPTKQRDLLRLLEVERATLSVVVTTLARKELVEQRPDARDQRQKSLHLSASGARLWRELPDLGTTIRQAAFDGISAADLAIAARVLRLATRQLDTFNQKRDSP